MNTKIPRKFQVVSSLLLVMVFLITSIGVSSAQDNPQEFSPDDPILVQPDEIEVVSPNLSLIHKVTADGKTLTGSVINGPLQPPVGYKASDYVPSSKDGTLANFPSFSWVFGCSAVSGAMIATYWDRNGYTNMYSGPTNGGVMPLTDTSWPTWSDGYDTYPNNPLIASHNGVDGRTVKGSIDDYWIQYGSTANDPYITGAWTQHTWSDAIGDYMKTSQSAYTNSDGSTTFWNWTSDPSPLTCADMVTYDIEETDGTYGRKLFYEARGYTVTDCYNRKTDNTITGGFSLADFKAQIDAGKPVFINLSGHSIVGYGYGTGTTIYIRNTWDNDPSNIYTMEWGGALDRGAMTMQSVSIVNLESLPSVPPKLVQPYGTLYDQTPTYKFKRVGGTTKYQYRVYTSTGTLKFTRTIYDSSCGTTYCVKVPTVTLPYNKYKWQARSYAGGTYSAWSAFKNFTIAKPPSGFSSSFNGSMSGWTKLYGPFSVNTTAMYSAGVDYWNTVYRSTNKYASFDYSAVIKRTGGVLEGSYPATYLGLRAGKNIGPTNHEWYPGIFFGYTNGGCPGGPCYAIYRVSNTGVFTWIQSFADTKAVKPDDWNTLRVVANGPTYKFYINGSLVKSFLNTNFSIGYVGMTFYKIPGTKTRFAADSAKLSVLLKTFEEFDEVSAEQEAYNQAAMETPYDTPEYVTIR